MSTGERALHPIEYALLKSLAAAAEKEEGQPSQPRSVEELTRATALDIDQVRRGIEWLKFKDMVSVTEKSNTAISISEQGRTAAMSGLPERRLVDALNAGMSSLAEIISAGKLQKEEANAAVAAAKRNGWIQFGQGGRMSVASTEQSAEERLLQKLMIQTLELSGLNGEDRTGYELLVKRPGYIAQKESKDVHVTLTETGKSASSQSAQTESQERRLTPDMITSGRWRQIKLAPLDVEAAAPPVFPGRRHPLVDIIEEIKEIFVGLGFEEIDGPMVQTGFWNFDALYIPQDHSAREMQDTFYLKKTRNEEDSSSGIPATDEQIRKVSAAHKKGWGSRWKAEDAKRMVLRTHTTPVTLRHLADAKPESARFFSVGRVFRNEKPSYKHLVEFHQVEGVATAKGLSLRDLMGLQTKFYAKMGIKKIKFWPTFFPYTEPSLQSMVYNESLQKWVELFGMGIFRPEVTVPLGIRNPVLAWGGGIERIAMLRYALDDVRDLYSSKLSWLRGVPKCQL